MSATPKISVVMPSLNQAAFIEEAILSVLEQEYPQKELIVVDGGSHDGSLEIIKKYSNRLSYWVSEKDSGQSEAINKGFRKATGEIVTWLNSDDAYEPGTMQHVSQLFTNDPAATFIHGQTLLYGEGKKTSVRGPEKTLPTHRYLSYMRFPQPSSFFKKEMLDKTGPLNEQLHFAMDFELFARGILLGAHPKATNRILSRYRLHETSKSNRDLEFLEEWHTVLIALCTTVPAGKDVLGKLKKLKPAGSTDSVTYPVTRQFTHNEMKEILLDHLQLQFHINYQHRRKKDCELIYSMLCSEDPDFTRRNHIRKYMRRLRYLPAFVFEFRKKLAL